MRQTAAGGASAARTAAHRCSASTTSRSRRSRSFCSASRGGELPQSGGGPRLDCDRADGSRAASSSWSRTSPCRCDRRVWQEVAHAHPRRVRGRRRLPTGSRPRYEPYEGSRASRSTVSPRSRPQGGRSVTPASMAQALWRTAPLVRRLSRGRHVRRRPRVQSARPLAPAALPLEAQGHPLRLRSPRPRSRALPVAVRPRSRPPLPRDAARRAAGVRTRRRRDRDERVVSADRDHTRRKGG